MKFLVSLKRSANLDGRRDRQSTHLSLVTFAVPQLDARMPAIHGNIETGLVEPPNARVQTRGPWVARLNGRHLGRPTSDDLSGVKGA